MFTNLCHRPSRRRPPVRRPRPRFCLEQLEDRAVPATILWDGGPTGLGTNWLDPVNWAGDVLPGPNDDAVIGTANNGQPGTVTLSGSASVQNVSVAAEASLILASATSDYPTLQASGSLSNAG